jgi:hypothetical protein
MSHDSRNLPAAKMSQEVIPAAELSRQVSRMSIRARVAFGLVCIERAIRQFGGSAERAEVLLNKLWEYTEAADLSSWGCAMDVEQLASAFGNEIPPSKLEVLSRLFKELDQIGGGNLFGGFRDEFTLVPTMNLLSIMSEHGIEPPSTERFIRTSPRRFWNAWGRPFSGRALRSGDDGPQARGL